MKKQPPPRHPEGVKRPRDPLRVGFDLDGVLLYNPARIARPVIYAIKRVFFKKELHKFHYPKTKMQKFIWVFLHKSSLFTAPGLSEIKKLIADKKIKAYIVTARYEFLKNDFKNWLNKIEADKYFSGYYFNNDDEQPHVFKERMIKKLNLDIFVEDNWDIVAHLRNKFKVFWVSNIFDRKIKHPYKFRSLRKAVEAISKKVK